MGVLVIKNINSNWNTHQGDIKRLSNLKINYENVRIKKVMTKKPICDKNVLAKRTFNNEYKKITSYKHKKK